MEQVIYLEIDDDITTVRDRLRRSQSKQVLLVIPAGSKALRRQLDLRLLSRQAAALQVDLALITGDATLRDLAVAEGLTVFATLSLGRRMARSQKEWKTGNLPGMEGLLARLKRQRPQWWNWLIGPVLIGLVLGVLVWGLVMVLPSATVSLVPAREAIGVSLVVEANPMIRTVDWDRLHMPARFVQVEVVERGQVETTGFTNVAADKATGTVLFVNRTTRQIAIPLGTRVSTSAGTPIFFETVVEAVVGARGQVRVPIIALEGGPGGNVGVNLINRVEGALEASLNVLNESGTYGGTSTQAKRVTHGDKQNATDLLEEKLILKAFNEITAELEGEFLPIETLQINPYSVQTNYDHHVDDQSDTLAVEMRGQVWGLVMSEESALGIARQALERQVRSGFHILPDTAHFSRGRVLQVDTEELTVRFLVEGVALMEATIDEPLVRKAIAGRPAGEALAYLRQALPVEVEPTLAIDPPWMIRVPWMPFRISIAHQERPKDLPYALPGT